MRVLVVFESMFGNTQQIAEAVCGGLRTRGATVELLEVSSSPHAVPDGVDGFVLGGPTHARGMSRPGTREAADRMTYEGLPAPVSQGSGIREWIERTQLPPRLPFACFDTRARGPRLLSGSAARAAHAVLAGSGHAPVIPPESFLVVKTGDDGVHHLVPGEAERARAWGETVAAHLRARIAPSP